MTTDRRRADNRSHALTAVSSPLPIGPSHGLALVHGDQQGRPEHAEVRHTRRHESRVDKRHASAARRREADEYPPTVRRGSLHQRPSEVP